jgi:NAD(P)-dependent dehydrogenase (short-subunit alcohol dehydrogenase family)
MQNLEDRNVIVTGAGTGIGRAIALRLSAAGAKVALVGRTRSKLEEVAGEAGGETFVVTADIAQQSQVEAAFGEIASTFGRLHDLIANAGVGGPNHPGEDDRWNEVVRANLDGTYHCVRAFERHLHQGPEPRHAILISSCLARFGVPGYTAYCASKAGLLGLTRSLAMEWAEKGVLVNSICPGWVDTEMARSGMRLLGEFLDVSYEEARKQALSEVPLQRISEPEEIAGLVAFLLSPDARCFTGQAFDPNNGAWMG